MVLSFTDNCMFLQITSDYYRLLQVSILILFITIYWVCSFKEYFFKEFLLWTFDMCKFLDFFLLTQLAIVVVRLYSDIHLTMAIQFRPRTISDIRMRGICGFQPKDYCVTQ